MKAGGVRRRSPTPPRCLQCESLLQRLQERDDLVALRGSQRAEPVDDAGRLTRVTQDRLGEGQRLAVVHVATVRPDAPQRLGAQLVRRALPAVLDDAVAG